MRVALLVTLAACALLGCSTPFSAAINEYQLDRPQAPATILLSDPQVYARETLVNDRRLEAEYLRGVLDDSRTARFEPQLRRDLQTLTGFVAQMNLLYDPSAGAAFGRNQQTLDEQREIDRINAEAALVRARATLLQEQRRLEALERGETPPASDAPQSSGQTTPTPASPTLPASPAATDTQAINALTLGELRALLASMDEIQGLMAQARELPRSAGVGASPQEIFRDRQTYREEIRAALADVNLDDGHDIEGNALYRLQFRATLLPGEHRGQFAVARITFAPPAMTNREIAELYLSWLAFVNRELNQRTVADEPGARQDADDERNQYTDDSFRSELAVAGAYSGLFDVVEFNAGNATNSVQIAAPPTSARYLRFVICSQQDGINLQRPECERARELYRRVSSARDAQFAAALPAVTLDDDVAPLRCATGTDVIRLRNELSSLDEYRREPALAISMLVAAAQAGLFTRQRHGTSAEEALFRRFVEYLREELSTRRDAAAIRASSLSDTIASANLNDACDNREDVALLQRQLADRWDTIFAENPNFLLGDVFSTFRALIQDPRDAARQRLHPIPPQPEGAAQPIPYRPVPRGDIAAFFARPIDQAQRISTVQGAANAIDLALALRAQTAESGVSGAFGANYVRQAVGRIDTVERAPIVVGFNDRTIVGDCTEQARLSFAMDCYNGDPPRALPQSGWVFGPPIAPAEGGSRLEARHNVVNHAVSTDISVPGWWPRIQAEVETAWVRNWDEAADGRVFRNQHRRATRIMNIELPHNSVDMHALTRLVAGLGAPLTTPQITAITPTGIRLCPTADNIRLQVAGRDVWQGSEAFLNGVPASNVRILPDMGGLDLTFPTRNLPQHMRRGPGGTNAEIVVWTRDSQTSTWITIEVGAADAAFCTARNEPTRLDGSSVRPAQTWIAPGADMRLEIADRAMLGDANEVRILLQRIDPATGRPSLPPVAIASTANAPVILNIGDNGLVSFNAPAQAQVGIEDGALVQIAIGSRPRSGGSETVVFATQRLTWYSARDQAAIAAGPLTASDTRVRMVITLPLRASHRYEGLADGATPPDPNRVTIVGSIAAGGQTYQFTTIDAWTFAGLNGSGQPTFARFVQLQGTPADAGTFATALNGAAAAGLTGHFSLMINGALAGASQQIVIKKG